MISIDVLIAGAGPVGLLLAHELSQRGIKVILAERNDGSTRHPKMDVTNPRSMEHFRRLGLAEELRAEGTPKENAFSVIWTEKLGGNPVARFDYPSYEQARVRLASINDGKGMAEPWLRISQILLEPLLRKMLERDHPQTEVNFGLRLDSFVDHGNHVISTLTDLASGEQKQIRSLYLAGCDGAGSLVRKQLGIEWNVMDTRTGPLNAVYRKFGFLAAARMITGNLRHGPRNLWDGRMYLINFRTKDVAFMQRNGTVWHEQCALHGDTLIGQDDGELWTLHVALSPAMNADHLDPKELLFQRLGRKIDCEILVANIWRPNLTVAKKFGRGRVWLIGDAAHQVIPTGGYGMNTGVGDAVTSAWMLAASVQGWGGPGLLNGYEAERKPVIENNRRFSALHFGVRGMIIGHPNGDAAKLGKFIRKQGNLENELHGVELDYRYTQSPLVVHESGREPAWRPEAITPSTWPGARLPHFWLEPDVAVFDKLGTGFTLVRLADMDVSGFAEAAEQMSIPFSLLDIRDPQIARVYERKLILVRPDHHVAWRGDHVPTDALEIFQRATGHRTWPDRRPASAETPA